MSRRACALAALALLAGTAPAMAQSINLDLGSGGGVTGFFARLFGRTIQGAHLVISSVEHPATAQPAEFLRKLGCGLTVVPVDGRGRVDPDAVAKALRPETVLVSVMHSNNEVGTLMPIREIAAFARAQGVLTHTDVAQSLGIPVRQDTYCFAITMERYDDIRTLKMRVLLVKEKDLALFAPDLPESQKVAPPSPFYAPRLKTLQMMHVLHKKVGEPGVPKLGRVILGVRG